MASIYTDKISSVECPKCGFHVRGAHRPNIFCRSCKEEITADSKYFFRMGSGINSLEWSWHNDCYGKVVYKGVLKE